MPRPLRLLLAVLLAAPAAALRAQPIPPAAGDTVPCLRPSPVEPRLPRTEAELRCRLGVRGPGRFGLLSYVDVPVYQPATPMPGTHVVGVPGHARPWPWESYEEWEWRVLRTEFGPGALRVNRGIEVLDVEVAARILRLEGRLADEGIRARRLETWRAPERQAWLFQQGRSRPGPLATSTLTSWHSQVDEHGHAAGHGVDYAVPPGQMRRFHEIAWRVGLMTFGADSNDPGHVFLPEREARTPTEMALLRRIPRVPEVTLATGLPVDRGLPPGGREALRAEAEEFAGLPFLPHVEPTLAGAGSALEVVGGVEAATRSAAADGNDAGAPRDDAAPRGEREDPGR